MLAGRMHNWYLDGQHHFVVDQGVAGVGGLRGEGEVGCNVQGAGLGVWPRCGEGMGVGKLDAVVWAREPGLSQGGCGRGEPERGVWWERYARMLLRNAVPGVVPL